MPVLSSILLRQLPKHVGILLAKTYDTSQQPFQCPGNTYVYQVESVVPKVTGQLFVLYYYFTGISNYVYADIDFNTVSELGTNSALNNVNDEHGTTWIGYAQQVPVYPKGIPNMECVGSVGQYLNCYNKLYPSLSLAAIMRTWGFQPGTTGYLNFSCGRSSGPVQSAGLLVLELT